MEDNILLHYTSLKNACKILSDFKLKMSFLKDSKDPLEAMLGHQSLHELDSPELPDRYTEGVQILCLAKSSFPICTTRRDAHECGVFPSYKALSQAMFYNYGNFGDGVCFILDREIFEKENTLPSREIKYACHPYSEIRKEILKYLKSNPTRDDDLYDILSIKHNSFLFENELRFFTKAEDVQYVTIANSCLGVCVGPRLTSPHLHRDPENTEGLFLQVICRIINNKKQLYGIDFNNNLVGHKYSDPKDFISPINEPVVCFAPASYAYPP